MAGPVHIESVHNAKVKQWAELLGKKGRDKTNRFIIEGRLLVMEALSSGASVRALVYAADQGLAAEFMKYLRPEIERFEVSASVLAKCSDTNTPQGILAIADKMQDSAESLLEAPNSLVVAVDGVQDPGNLGTIIRSADAAGADGVLVGAGSVDLYNPKTIRSTMGSIFHLPIISCVLPDVLRNAKTKGIPIFDTRLDASSSIYDHDYTGPAWFVIGNEANGVSPEAGALADRHVKIPMPGRAESLNAAMAAAVLLYEALRQRMCKSIF